MFVQVQVINLVNGEGNQMTIMYRYRVDYLITRFHDCNLIMFSMVQIRYKFMFSKLISLSTLIRIVRGWNTILNSVKFRKLKSDSTVWHSGI